MAIELYSASGSYIRPVTSKPLEYFLPLATFGLTPLYKILPHSRTTKDMNFIFTTKWVEVFVHMIFKSGLLNPTGLEIMA